MTYEEILAELREAVIADDVDLTRLTELWDRLRRDYSADDRTEAEDIVRTILFGASVPDAPPV